MIRFGGRSLGLILLISLLATALGTFQVSRFRFQVRVAAADEKESSGRLGEFQEHIDSWDLAGARAILNDLEKEDSFPPATITSMRSVLAFYSGRYKEAVALLDEVRDPTLIREGGYSLADIIRKTGRATQDFVRTESAHFEVWYRPGVDEVMVDDLLSALDRAHEYFSRAMGFAPGEPIRVEIYSDYDGFRHSTTLTERDLEVSGAVGVCKFNKLMILTPRLLLRGYRYLDTAVHEYVHFIVYRMTRNRAPVWLHEGIASYLEALFERDVLRADFGPAQALEGASGEGAFRTELSPSSETLLQRALESNGFIPFERMHPSLVKLETRDEVALAFAEVQMSIELLMVRTEGKGLKRLLIELGKGTSLSEALSELVGVGLDQFEAMLKEYVLSRGLRAVPGLEPPRFTLKKEGAEDDLEVRQIGEKQARDFVRLGDLLKARGRYESATIEYRKAKEREPRSPIILNKLGQSLILAGGSEQAVEILEEARGLYPDFSTTYYHLGEAHLGLGHTDQAVRFYSEATRMNPFHPIVRQRLAGLYKKRGEEAGAAREEEKLRSLHKYGK